jgi:hypothetical protein
MIYKAMGKIYCHLGKYKSLFLSQLGWNDKPSANNCRGKDNQLLNLPGTLSRTVVYRKEGTNFEKNIEMG